MRTRLLMSDRTLFRSIDVFEIDYAPEFFNYRGSQLNDLAYPIRPALEGERALSAICRGLPGTGKTSGVLRIFAELEHTTRKIVPVYVNCQNDRTKYVVFSRILQFIREGTGGGDPPPVGKAANPSLHGGGRAGPATANKRGLRPALTP